MKLNWFEWSNLTFMNVVRICVVFLVYIVCCFLLLLSESSIIMINGYLTIQVESFIKVPRLYFYFHQGSQVMMIRVLLIFNIGTENTTYKLAELFWLFTVQRADTTKTLSIGCKPTLTFGGSVVRITRNHFFSENCARVSK